MDIAQKKRCSKCRTYKESESYNRNTKSKDGLQTYCKQCFSEYRKHNTEYKCRVEKYYAEFYRKNRERLIRKRAKRSMLEPKKWL